MIIPPNLQQVLHRRLTRKEFVQVVGLMLLSVIGVSRMLQNVNNSFASKNKSDTYGGSSYGG